MKTYTCQCGNNLHFENSICVNCQKEVGWCPECSGIRSLTLLEQNTYSCDHCSSRVTKCRNYREFNVCNQMVAIETTWQSAPAYCHCCQPNRTVPDLSVPGNQEKWYQLELAKRRMMYTLDLLELPYASAAERLKLPLRFDFKADVMNGESSIAEKTFTGHADGVITINIQEADPVEREKRRVKFGEAHRTLIGHFHHEIGHYYWQLLVQNICEQECIAVFGDHNNPPYGVAMQQYYQNGPSPDWPFYYISAYASMHPWEDFAETFRGYLEMIAVLDTAENVSLLIDAEEREDFQGVELETLLGRYEQLGIKLNEMNRTLGLQDLVPEVYNTAVTSKMRFIHQLVKKGRKIKREMKSETVSV